MEANTWLVMAQRTTISKKNARLTGLIGPIRPIGLISTHKLWRRPVYSLVTIKTNQAPEERHVYLVANALSASIGKHI